LLLGAATGRSTVPQYTNEQIIIPDEDFRNVMEALKTELEPQPSGRTAVLRTSGGQEALLTRLSSGQLVFYNTLTEEDVAKNTGTRKPGFLIYGFTTEEEPEVKAALETLST
jgi:hypothetical protein